MKFEQGFKGSFCIKTNDFPKYEYIRNPKQDLSLRQAFHCMPIYRILIETQIT